MQADILQNGKTIMLSGALVFDTTMNIYRKSLPMLRSKPDFTIDLSGVTHADSAALALLIEWRHFATHQNIGITFTHIPKAIHNMAVMSNVLDLLL